MKCVKLQLQQVFLLVGELGHPRLFVELGCSCSLRVWIGLWGAKKEVMLAFTLGFFVASVAASPALRLRLMVAKVQTAQLEYFEVDA
jgi:hypothetical protein